MWDVSQYHVFPSFLLYDDDKQVMSARRVVQKKIKIIRTKPNCNRTKIKPIFTQIDLKKEKIELFYQTCSVNQIAFYLNQIFILKK